MNHVEIQRVEFKAGEYGEMVISGHPVISDVLFDFYPKGVFGEPAHAVEAKAGVAAQASVGGKGLAGEPERERQVETGEAAGQGEYGPAEDDSEGLAEAFAHPRMALYCSSNPAGGWKLVGEFKSHYYKRAYPVMYYRVIHPAGCPFEGSLIALATNN